MIAVAVQEAGWWPAWELFGDALLGGLLLAAVLPLLGIVLVLRQQTFVAAAIGQAANFGIAVTMVMIAASTGGHAHEVGAALGGGLLAAVLASIAALRAMSARASTLEARSAFVFLVCGSGALLLLADAPHGAQALQRLFLSSLLAIGRGELLTVGFAAAVVLALAARHAHAVLAWAMDPRTTAAHGGRVLRMDVLVGCVLGLVLGLAMHVAGLVFTFGLTILPVLAVREVALSLRAVLLAAPVLGVVVQALAFALAHRFDLPPGQVAVVVAGGAVVLARGFASLSRWSSVRAT